MNIYFNDSVIGISINTWNSIAFFTYLILEIVSLTITKMSLTHRLIITPFLIYQVKKIIPVYFRVKKFPYFIKVKSLNSYVSNFEIHLNEEVITEFHKSNNFDEPIATSGFLFFGKFEFNFFGKIVNYEVNQQRVDAYNQLFKQQIKQYNRSKSLEKIGL